ncbi:MAG: hypothetical protein ABII79_11375 [bacterium]
MQKPVTLLEKWLIEKPDDAITIICSEREPHELLGKLLDSIDVPYKTLDSTTQLPNTTKYRLEIPPLHDRLEDLPLITESTLRTHIENHEVEATKLPLLYLAAFFFLCWKYESPLKLTTPILTYDKLVSYLQGFLDSGRHLDPPFKLALLDFNDEGESKRNQALQPFTALHDEIVTVLLSDVPEEDAGFCVHEDNELQASLIAPETDRETGGSINEHRMHLWAAVSGEFRHIIMDKHTGLSKRQLSRKIQLDDIQRQMIRVGSKFAPTTENIKIEPIPQIHLKRRDSYKALVRFIRIQALREQLSRYLLVESHSPAGHELVERVISEYDLRDQDRTVFLKGDRFFSDMIQPLLKSWGITVCHEGDETRPDYRTLYVPGPSERKEDIPSVVSYVVQDFAAKFRERGIEIPKYICGETLLLLLTDSLWTGFDHLRDFLYYFMRANWDASNNTVLLGQAVTLGRDTFEGKSHLQTLDEQHLTSDNLKDFFPGFYETEREKTLWGIVDHFMEGPQPKHIFYLPTLVREYVYASWDMPGTMLHPFPLEAVRQAMHNIRVLSDEHPNSQNLDKNKIADINEIISIRLKQVWPDLKAKREEEEDQSTTVWPNWNVDTEISDVAAAGLCDQVDYENFMADLCFNLSFPDADTVYDEWDEIRQAFGLPTRETGGSAAVGTRPKFLIHQDDESVVSDGIKYCLPQDRYLAVFFIAEQHKKGNPWVRKKAIYDYCRVFDDEDRESAQTPSVREWFIDAEGDAARLAQKGLIETNPSHNGTCRIPVDPELIEFIPHTGEDSEDSVPEG